jgi:hypothetical protein
MMQLLQARDRNGVGSRPTLIGFDGRLCRTENDYLCICDSLLPFTERMWLEEYIDHIFDKRRHWWENPFGKSVRSEFNELKDRLHEKGANYVYRNKNLNVDAGINQIAKLMTARSTVSWAFMNVGTGTGATTAGMNELVTPLTPRFPLSGRWDSFNYAYHTCFYGLNDGNGAGTAIIVEVAPFTLVTGGIMLGRFVVPAYSKDNTKSFKVVYSTRLTPIP